MLDKRIKVKLVSIKEETKNVKTFRFKTIKEKLEFSSGQFIFLYAFLNGEEIKRAYSIASSPLDDYIELTIELVNSGKMTSLLHNGIKIGKIFEISKARGNFVFDEQMKNIVLIAGGCGIAPHRSIIRHAIKKKLDAKITLFYSCKSQNAIIYKKEFEEYQKKNPNLKIVYTLTRDTPKEWKGCIGRIDVDLIKKNVKDINNQIYFLCGPNEMVKLHYNSLKEMGIPAKNIKMDLWGS